MFQASTKSRFRAAFRTDTGLKRKTNEDTVFADVHMGLFIVSDGMGGHNAGEIASRTAVHALKNFVGKGAGTNVKSVEFMNQAFMQAHQAVILASLESPNYDEMGCTLVTAFSDGERSFVIGNVGDSRAYQIDSHGIRLLTSDHTFVAEWIRQGMLSSAEARTHNARHGLFMAVGIDDDFKPDMTRILLEPGDLLLLCSDGLTDMVEENIIMEIISKSQSIESACDDLIAEANANGGDDNSSALLIKVS